MGLNSNAVSLWLINQGPLFLSLFILLIVWSFIWKGIALWKAARNNSVPWFVVLLLVNTVGILEILYIYIFSKKQKESSQI